MSLHHIQYGNTRIEFDLSYAARKTLAISVHPDLRVTVEAPDKSALDAIEQKVRKRARWILRQQRDFERYLPHLPPRQYVSGETHRYLGRQYRLKVERNNVEVVKLARGRIFINVIDPGDKARVKELLDGWYRRQAKRVFRERLDACYPRVQHLGIKYPELALRVMKSRWGSCTQSGRIILNVKLIQVPKEFIDYVVVHEMCHLKEHNHSRKYYDLMDRVMPDWKQHRDQLNRFDFG
jgi:predicted metal-dependent hydrolase